MGAAQDLDKPDLAAATAGLWDNRSNYDASGNVYPSTGGSGTSGAVLKSDQWRISVAGTLGGTAVSVGDVLVALVDTPGSTSSNWMVLQGNVVAFTGDSGSGGLEGLVPAPAAGDSAAGKFLKANGQWAAVSASNLGSANLTSNAAVRSYTLAGTASTDYLDFLSGGGSPSSFFRLQGDKIITFGNSAAPIKRNLYYMSSAASSEFVYYRDNSQFLSIDANNRQIYLSGGTGQILMSGTTGILSTYGDSATMYNFKANGDLRGAWGLEYGHGNAFLSTSAGGRNIYMNANGWCSFNRNTSIGIDYNTNPSARLQVAGSGATSATTTALFQNSSSVNALKIRDDNYIIQRAINAPIADADLANNEMSAYIDESLNLLIFKVKYSSGAVKTVSLALI